ncbi:dodecenoyl-CoA isomerase [Branchiostoma belcheri]|nr:dodecenoyl-CoA isomerase [Branchiostoma belcheri]
MAAPMKGMSLLRQAFQGLVRPAAAGGQVCRSQVQHRCYNAPAAGHVQVDMNSDTGVATVRLNRPPVNSLNLDVLTELSIALEKLETDRSCRAMVLASAVPGIFSAGLDIMEMYKSTPERCVAFWRALQDAWLNLYGSRLVTMAAIEGHSPAGGCLLAMSCDYRVMADGKFQIGLNETRLGIVAPFWFTDVMLCTIGHRETEKALQLGAMYSAQQALSIGLVDKVVPADQVMSTVQTELKSWLQIPDAARVITKTSMRKQVLDRLRSQKEKDAQFFADFILRESVQKSLGAYIASLQKKKS